MGEYEVGIILQDLMDLISHGRLRDAQGSPLDDECKRAWVHCIQEGFLAYEAAQVPPTPTEDMDSRIYNIEQELAGMRQQLEQIHTTLCHLAHVGRVKTGGG